MVNVVLLLTFRAPLLGFLDHLEGRIWISKTISLGYEKKICKIKLYSFVGSPVKFKLRPLVWRSCRDQEEDKRADGMNEILKKIGLASR